MNGRQLSGESAKEVEKARTTMQMRNGAEMCFLGRKLVGENLKGTMPLLVDQSTVLVSCMPTFDANPEWDLSGEQPRRRKKSNQVA